jgi:dual specificity phosphatase 12
MRRKEEEEDRKVRGLRQNMDAPWIMWQPPEPKKNLGQESMDMIAEN